MMLTSLKQIKDVLQSLCKKKPNLQYKYHGDFALECIDLELDYETFLRKGNEWDPERDINIDHNAKDEVEKRWKWFHSYKSGHFMKYVWVEVTFYFCMIYISATDDDRIFYNSTFEDNIPICFHFLDTVKDADYAIRKHIYPLQIDFCNIRAYEVRIQHQYLGLSMRFPANLIPNQSGPPRSSATLRKEIAQTDHPPGRRGRDFIST
jgi:hypothetical protein